MNVSWLDNDAGVSVYQSREYGEAAATSAGSAWDVIGDANGLWRVPLCVSQLEDGHRDAASPYGYPGIWASPDLSEEEIEYAWAKTVESLAERGIVTVFFRFAPYRRGVERQHELPGLKLVEMSDTVLVDLGDEATMWDSMHGRSRTAIRKAEREGLRARVVLDRPINLNAASGFRRVYEAAMDRVAASAAHWHTDDYYRRLTHATDVDIHLVEVLDREGEVVAATLLLVDEEAVHYHLSGSFVEAARNGANNLLIWTAMKWAAQNGHLRFHLGGGTSRDDGLYRFKASFGGEPLPYCVGQLIVLPEVYGELVSRRARALEVPISALQDEPFFPAYRAVAP